jgi:hypothetical protein
MAMGFSLKENCQNTILINLYTDLETYTTFRWKDEQQHEITKQEEGKQVRSER